MPNKLEKYDQIYYKNDNPPPINQTNLNKMEEGISVNRDAIIALQEASVDLPFSVHDGKLYVFHTSQ